MKWDLGPPATLGSTATANFRLIVWYKDCQHQVEPDPAEMAQPLRRRDRRPARAADCGNGDAALSERLRMRGFGHLSR